MKTLWLFQNTETEKVHFLCYVQGLYKMLNNAKKYYLFIVMHLCEGLTGELER